MDLADKKTVTEILSKHKLWAKKRLGQNFLVDKFVLQKIIQTANLNPKDLVVEVGSGIGTLTSKLAENAGFVLAVEVDENMIKILKETCGQYKNLKIVRENILKLYLEKELYQAKKAGYKVVANLPYNITSAAIRYFLTHKIKPNLMVVMVQKEVAERICAQPPKMSLLAVATKFYGRPEIEAIVGKNSFFPIPKVDSAIVKISHIHYPENGFDEKLFFRIVKAGFSSRRKQLHNSLASGLDMTDFAAHEFLKKAKIDPARRAETLSMVEWRHLYSIIQNAKIKNQNEN